MRLGKAVPVRVVLHHHKQLYEISKLMFDKSDRNKPTVRGA